MSIIFYETLYCETLLTNRKKEVNQRDLNFLAKYWRKEDLSDHELRLRLEKYSLDADKKFNIVTNHYQIKNAINHSRRYSLRTDPLPVTVCYSDLKKIESIGNYSYEKIIFVALVCAKYFKYHISRNHISKKIQPSEFLYSNQKIRDILELANVAMTKKEWDVAKHILCVNGYISPTIYSKDKFALWLEEKNMLDGVVVMDYRNVVGYYQQYKGERMITCSECGILVVKNSNRQTMCKECSNKKRLEIKRKWQINYRKNVEQ